MEIKPATIFLLVVLMIALILPVFFLDMNSTDDKGAGPPPDPPPGAPHPHQYPPEMERALEQQRREGREYVPPPKPANEPPANEARPDNTPPATQ